MHILTTPDAALPDRDIHTAPGRPMPQGFDHGAVSRFNAWFFATFDGYINLIARAHTTAAFSDIDDVVVELGAGTGANLGYLRPETRLIALEPSRQMHERLRRRAREAGSELTILAEVRRALRPGGRFRFVEHIAAPRWSPRRWLQRAVRGSLVVAVRGLHARS